MKNVIHKVSGTKGACFEITEVVSKALRYSVVVTDGDFKMSVSKLSGEPKVGDHIVNCDGQRRYFSSKDFAEQFDIAEDGSTELNFYERR